MSDPILLAEIGKWTEKYERLRLLLTKELGLADFNDILAAEARGYRKAIERLLDRERQRSWLIAQPDGVTLTSINGVVAYLEAEATDPNAIPTSGPRTWAMPEIPADVMTVRDGRDMPTKWFRYGLHRDWWATGSGELDPRCGADLIADRGPITEVVSDVD